MSDRASACAMHARGGMLLAALGSALVVTVYTGSERSLVAMHPLLVVAFGAACVALAFAQRRFSSALLAACWLGACAGALLPHTIPVGAVITRAPAAAHPSDLFALLDELDAHPAAMIGRRARVTGTWTPARDASPATVSRRVMTCCAADAVDVGLDVQLQRAAAVPAGSSVCVDGVIGARLRDGELRYELERASVRVSRCSAR